MLMEHLPPVGWGDVATQRDVADVRSALQIVRSEMATKVELAEFRTEMRVGFAELRAEIATSQRQLMYSLLFVILASTATVGGLAFSAARLG